MKPGETLIHPLTSLIDFLRLEDLFDAPRPTALELGSGDGSFLFEYARRHPDRNFLGVERLLGRLRKLDKKGRRSGLSNLCLLRIEARYLVQHLLPPDAFADLHIYFPDPWPKEKHARHRLINPAFPVLAARILSHGATLHLRTDDPKYFAQMHDSFTGTPFQPINTPAELAALKTDFEKEFNAKGHPTLSASYKLENQSNAY